VIPPLTHVARLARAGFVFAREGVLGLIDPSPLPFAARSALTLARLCERRGTRETANRLAKALTRLGPSYVKLGQFLATRPDVVGVPLARDLESLQDRMPPFPQAEAEAVVAAALGRPLAAAFTAFGPAVAAASIAQVHRAEVTTPAGPRAVAVKVLRPGVDRRFRVDLDSFFYVARKAEAWSAQARRLRLVETVDTLARSVALEMDFRLEAAALSEMAENTADDPGFRVPAIDWDRTAREVLTLEWIDGTPLSDHATLRAKGFDFPSLAQVVIQTFLRHALRDGFFHADMHPGNLFVDAEGRLVAVDFGIMGRLGPKERRFLAEILYGFITRNYYRAAEVHFEAGYVPKRFRWPSCCCCCSRSPACSICARGRSCCCCRRPWWWSRAWHARSIPSSTCGGPRSRWCANGSSAISARPGGCRMSHRAPARSASSSAACRRCCRAAPR
jgi:ubiquinone biosynthesis protein